MTDKTEQVSTYVTPEKKQCLRIAVAKQGIRMAEWIRRAIDNEFERQNVAVNGEPAMAAVSVAN